jgi:hypothetical protein
VRRRFDVIAQHLRRASSLIAALERRSVEHRNALAANLSFAADLHHRSPDALTIFLCDYEASEQRELAAGSADPTVRAIDARGPHFVTKP